MFEFRQEIEAQHFCIRIPFLCVYIAVERSGGEKSGVVRGRKEGREGGRERKGGRVRWRDGGREGGGKGLRQGEVRAIIASKSVNNKNLQYNIKNNAA